jgi:N-acetylglutamate synthase
MNYRTRQMTIRDYDAVIDLWRGMPGIGLDADCDSRKGIARYLKRNPGLSFVACAKKGVIVGAVLSGHDGRRGYLAHLAVAPEVRKQGIGRALVARCLRALARHHIPKCNIFVFRSNVRGRGFWLREGWNLRRDLDVLQHKTAGT